MMLPLACLLAASCDQVFDYMFPHDGTVEISYIPDPQLKRKIIPGDVDGCNLELPTLNTVTPFSDSGPTILLRVYHRLWYYPPVFDSTQVLDSTEVVEDVLEARCPRLAKAYFEFIFIMLRL